MLSIGPRTTNLILGTATPIQTAVSEIWDLMKVLNSGADFVLGREIFSKWADYEKALPIVKGDQIPQDEREAWGWLQTARFRSPSQSWFFELKPPEDSTFAALLPRNQLSDVGVV